MKCGYPNRAGLSLEAGYEVWRAFGGTCAFALLCKQGMPYEDVDVWMDDLI